MILVFLLSLTLGRPACSNRVPSVSDATLATSWLVVGTSHLTFSGDDVEIYDCKPGFGTEEEDERRCFSDIGDVITRVGPLVSFYLDSGLETVLTLDADRLRRFHRLRRLAIFASPFTDCVWHLLVDLRSGQSVGIMDLPDFSPSGRFAVSMGSRGGMRQL